MQIPEIPQRPWSNADFMKILFDQALIAYTQGEEVWEGGWKTEEARLKAWGEDGGWMAAIVSAFMKVCMEECNMKSRRVILDGHTLSSLEHKVQREAPWYTPWYVDWAMRSVVRVLESSPHFKEAFTFKLEGTEYRFAHHNGRPWFERLTNRQWDDEPARPA